MANLKGEEIETLILTWLRKYDPDWEERLLDPGLDYFYELPLEIRMVPAFRKLERNLINGGWPQFLWNCLGNWRAFIDVAKQGHQLIGVSSSSLTEELDQLHRLCEIAEDECRHAHSIASEAVFGAFVEKFSNIDNTFSGMDLWSGSDSYWKRIKWFKTHEAEIHQLLKHLPHTL